MFKSWICVFRINSTVPSELLSMLHFDPNSKQRMGAKTLNFANAMAAINGGFLWIT